jgi:hypothetical protein
MADKKKYSGAKYCKQKTEKEKEQMKQDVPLKKKI